MYCSCLQMYSVCTTSSSHVFGVRNSWSMRWYCSTISSGCFPLQHMYGGCTIFPSWMCWLYLVWLLFQLSGRCVLCERDDLVLMITLCHRHDCGWINYDGWLMYDMIMRLDTRMVTIFISGDTMYSNMHTYVDQRPLWILWCFAHTYY